MADSFDDFFLAIPLPLMQAVEVHHIDQKFTNVHMDTMRALILQANRLGLEGKPITKFGIKSKGEDGYAFVIDYDANPEPAVPEVKLKGDL